MDELFYRSNVIYQKLGDQLVLIYEDHRTSLAVLDHANRKGLFPEPPTLVLFDRHDDAKPPNCGDERIQHIRSNPLSPEEFWQFVEWELSPTDDDWVNAAMGLDLVGDVILIGACQTINVDDMNGKLTDASGKTHHIYEVGHLWEGLDYQGWLSDSARSMELQPIWDLLGWHPIRGFTNDQVQLVIDIDLDCFTLKGPSGEALGWPDSTFLELFTKQPNFRSPRRPWTAAEFFNELADRSCYISIARESAFCGGIGESDRLLQLLDMAVFDGRLRPSTYGR